MRTLSKRNISSLADIIVPLSFVSASLVNIILYYLGLAYVENAVRTYGFILCKILFAVLCGLVFLAKLKETRFSFATWALLVAVCLFYAIYFAVGLLQFKFDPAVIDYLEKFICVCVPAFFCGICAAADHTEHSIFDTLDRLSCIAFPACVIYFNGHIFGCSPFGNGWSLGIMSYMDVAYYFMPFFLAHIICFIEKRPLRFPLSKKELPHPQIVRSCMIAIYWVAIIGSGTRGAYFSIFAFLILLFISKLLFRESIKQYLKVITPMVAVFLFLLFVYTPSSMQSIHRLDIFLDGLRNGKIVTAVDRAPSASAPEDESASDGGTQLASQKPEHTPAPAEAVAAAPSVTPPSDAAPSSDPSPSDSGTGDYLIFDRGSLYSLALKEFKKSPLVGMGPMGFTVKYGQYTHNLFLEILCDLGLFGFVPMVLLILWAAWKFLYIARRDRAVRYVVIFLCAYVVKANISGSFWTCDALLFALGYGISAKASCYPAPESGQGGA